jgi:hypothetical protein
MVHMQIVRKDFSLELREELAWIASAFRRFKLEQREEARRVGFRADRPIPHVCEVVRDKIDNAVPELAHLVERQRDAGAIN